MKADACMYVHIYYGSYVSVGHYCFCVCYTTYAAVLMAGSCAELP